MKNISKEDLLRSHPVLLHVLVVGFHHKKGYEIEFCYPKLSQFNGTEKNSEDDGFPEAWSALPSLAIPDGAHNVESDIIYFVLPSLTQQNRTIYGISCYRQIPADATLRQRDSTVTRSSIQKSVCVLSKVPLFGILKSKLELITQAYFNEKDFSKVDVLVQMYKNLCDLFDSNYLDIQTIYTGISLTPLLATFKHRILILFKLLLLERRVIFNIFPVQNLGSIMIGLVSLFPGMLEEGLSESAFYSFKRRCAAGIQNFNEDEQNSGRIQEEFQLQSTSANPSSFNTNNLGFPLSIFTKGSIFHPYLGINSLDMIRSEAIRAYCIGVTNSLFIQRHDLIDVIVTINDNKEGQIDILSVELKRELLLTKQDLRFIDYILKMVEMREMNSAVWEGGDDWIRSQFHTYLLAMLAAAKNFEASTTTTTTTNKTISKMEESTEDIATVTESTEDEFNNEFLKAWKSKHNYRVWSCTSHSDFVDISPRHPFSGQLNVNDVILRVNQSEPARRFITTFANTSKYVSETGNRFKLWIKNTVTTPTTPTPTTPTTNE